MKDVPKLWRIIARGKGYTVTAQTSYDMSEEDAVRAAEECVIDPNANYERYVMQPICTERQWKYGQINFCPRCGKNICDDLDDGQDQVVVNVQTFVCPECDAEMTVEIHSTPEEDDDLIEEDEAV